MAENRNPASLAAGRASEPFCLAAEHSEDNRALAELQVHAGPSPELRPLRPHQERALDALRKSLASGHRRPMLQMPTGAGKTLTERAYRLRRARQEQARRVLRAAQDLDRPDRPRVRAGRHLWRSASCRRLISARTAVSRSKSAARRRSHGASGPTLTSSSLTKRTRCTPRS